MRRPLTIPAAMMKDHSQTGMAPAWRRCPAVTGAGRHRVLGYALSLALTAGCADPAHEQRVGQRVGNMEHALGVFAEDEARRPGNLARTADMARLYHEREVQNFNRDLDALDQGVKAEFQRFHDRQGEYERQIGEELRDSPETIERTLPYVLY